MAKKIAEVVSEEVLEKEVRFTKSEILASETYVNDRDLISVLLSDSEEYTTKEVEKIIAKWKGEEIC